ncbi:hypothetical protein [Conexibacter woesei]|uniref:Uncharacterized protein n=1 Tax=Conexibacter woesei (strain DSM 14684 / CCUG 47730 / CIP 108061 / JCM 11494 / NBRC 100937 / ID131577) TaxID=469383 RepID=D3F9K3_CONWI|nr:hypothetical protein [Conexibacter woesei]ADB51065.1 hypothetical protein Cwoe_2646 [Conexibacter woesei DSM 14684]
MTSRLLARLATGPVAFLLAGAADLSVAWGRWARSHVRARMRARLPRKAR